ncbi:archaeal ATPase [Galdieria sulphuraria]|uniref:Archaeal ATPase n=1 Tax=Galdieria sulphuraria TaxID=130081 RepID=M2XC93_GALSU|nr:archaeal ATPase [Galdieria sulphuraria]EME27537.1 archaeal ATPase [Galdieria sulphuraria]|eukprot:XP_005704057.1 archaeal ATPase [Galdieria sulphuraria]
MHQDHSNCHLLEQKYHNVVNIFHNGQKMNQRHVASLEEKWEAVVKFKSVVVDRERDVVRVTKELYDLHSNREQLRGVTSSCDYRLTIPLIVNRGKQ